MEPIFSKSFFIKNRTNLKKLRADSLPIVLTASGLMQRGGDNTFPFHQDATFWYLTGLEEPDFILVISSDNEFIILPERTKVQDIFNGVINESTISNVSGVKTILSSTEGWALLNSIAGKSKTVSTLPPAPKYIKPYGMYANPARQNLSAKLKQLSTSFSLHDITSSVIRLRTIKQQSEINAIQKAIDITSDTIKEVRDKLKVYKQEYEVEAAITQGFRSRGASGHAFSPIVASGKNANVVHYSSNNQSIEWNGLILIDIGAEVKHYCSDIARTFSVHSKPSTRQKNVYDAVLETQNYAITLLKPGVMIRDYELQVRKFMAKKLNQLGIIKKRTVKNTLSNFPYATSHFLGLEPHDIGDYQQPIQPGMILTAEPGIHIQDEGIGVRIEDDILITKTGNKNLSRDLPRSLV